MSARGGLGFLAYCLLTLDCAFIYAEIKVRRKFGIGMWEIWFDKSNQ